jgi:pimeloyl-ACP methyl ester carboxylesterase
MKKIVAFEMKSDKRFPKSLNLVVLVSMLAGILGTTITPKAQGLRDLQTQRSPLVLKAQGSFYVGGDVVGQTQAELGSFGPAGHITINQMYVRYMIPQGDRNAAVVMIHGMTHTGKAWETTPDGRMGWDEYFARRGHAVYVPDQVGRGRSGFNQAIFNDVRAGAAPPDSLPAIWRFGDEVVWPNFRFGPRPSAPYPGLQFPVEALGELSKQSIPDLSLTLPTPNPTYKALSDLAGQLKRAVLISHSQSGAFPLEAALVNSAGVKGAVLVEPGVCPATYTDQQIATLATLPIMIVFGDNLDTPTGIPGFSWRTAYEGCRAFVTRVNAAGGNARMLYLPDRGIRSNSHMVMQDRNNLQIADLILKWIDESVGRKVRVNSRLGRSPRSSKN